MLVPISWLAEYVDVSDISLDELRKRMSSSGLAVERQHTVGEGIEQIIVGEIKTKEKHPDSDHLWVTTVEIGHQPLQQIVTGAQNIFVGAKVPIIVPGQVLPNGTKIEQTKLRGVDSAGMMCSEKELELGDNHDGIMILGSDAVIGEKLVAYLGLPDVVFDVEVTSNRGDSLSIYGIAREVATLFHKELKLPKLKSAIESGKSEKIPSISVTVEDAQKCPRFAVVGFDHFKLSPSPTWMQQRLLRAGMRPINNLVDITNYVMLELGQPSHAYDALQVVERTFIVRNAKPGEELETLDGKKFKMPEESVVIADPQKALGIAGIMGGMSSKITDSTEALLLETANFDPVTTRRTGMKLNIRSEAIVRFERGVDREAIPIAIERLHFLLHEYTGANLVTPVVEVYKLPWSSQQVTLTSYKLAVYMQEQLPLRDVERILNDLGFKTVEIIGDEKEWRLSVSVPSWRWRDVTIEEDLIEEVARIYGYDNLKRSTPVGIVPFVADNKRLQVKRSTLQTLKGLGLQEVLTYSFNSGEQIEMAGFSVEKALEMSNPLTVEQRYLRLSLLPNLVWVAEKNKHLKRDIDIYELSSVYTRKSYDMLPDEGVGLAFEPVFMSGVFAPQSYSFEDAYAHVRNTLQTVFASLGVRGVTYTQEQDKIAQMKQQVMFHPGRVGGISLDGENVIGVYGELHPALQERLNLAKPVFMFEMRFDPIVEMARLIPNYTAYSVYPETTEALSFILDEKQPVGPIVSTLYNLDPRIRSIEVGRPFKGDKMDTGKQAVTFTFVYLSNNGVIKEKDAEEIRERIISYMDSAAKAILRG